DGIRSDVGDIALIEERDDAGMPSGKSRCERSNLGLPLPSPGAEKDGIARRDLDLGPLFVRDEVLVCGALTRFEPGLTLETREIDQDAAGENAVLDRNDATLLFRAAVILRHFGPVVVPTFALELGVATERVQVAVRGAVIGPLILV